jgi:molybdenum cofactor synthesis domain-containing protein
LRERAFMKTVAVRDAVGMVLEHDLTEIIPGQFKGVAFQKGHIVTAEDIPRLLRIGKEHLYVLELGQGVLHENEAARRMAAAAAGPGIRLSEPREGKVEMWATMTGLLKIDVEALQRINEIDSVMFATIHTDHVVQEGRKLGGTRIIPLVIEKRVIETVEAVCRSCMPLISVKPLKPHTVGVVTTGSEVYHGRIQDTFGPVLAEKFTALGSRILRQIVVDDNVDMIADAIRTLIAEGADFIATTGGMSVDPDDVTPQGIRAAGGELVTYGAPVLPGAMFLLARLDGIPVVGLPGCVMYVRTSVFELVVPRLLAGETVTRSDIARLGHGGFCLSCADCRYPDCGFGK